MIQFNLLPDVKIKYIKSQRTKRKVILASLVVSGASLLVVALLFISVQVVQKKRLDDISKDIVTQTNQLKNVPDLDKILTIQNQLSALPALHDGKPLSSRLLDYLTQVTPAAASVSSISADFSINKISITGNADSSATVNKYADTLKFATYTSSKQEAGKPFSEVVTSISAASGAADPTRQTSFTLSFNFDPILFNNTESPTLTIPKITSTRSETEKPSAIFKESTKPTQTQGAN